MLDDTNFTLPDIDTFSVGNKFHDPPNESNPTETWTYLMIDQLIATKYEIDPDIYNKYIDTIVILDNMANGDRNIAGRKRW